MAPDDNLEATSPRTRRRRQFQDEETRRRVAEHYAKAAGFGRAADMREACLRLLPRPEPPGPPMVAFHARGPWHPLAGAVVTFAGAREPAGLLRGMVARPDGRLEVQVELYSGAER